MAHAGDWVEIAVIVLWAMWVGQNYLNLDPTLWPAGTGLGGKAVGHYFWIAVKQCGLCALWNGAVNGGAPALADRFGSQFHPLVAITTLLWGIIPGLKITLIAIHALTGIAQWWIARALSLGRLARLWSALLAVIGGHLATKYDEGNFGVLLAIATCSLTLAAALALGVKAQRRPRDVVIVAGLGAMAIVAGQGYIQLALLSWAPAFLFCYSINSGI